MGASNSVKNSDLYPVRDILMYEPRCLNNRPIKLERRGEAVYAEMYERGSPLGLLSEIKECFGGAIAAAEGEGPAAEAARLRARLDYVVAVYRRQFT